MCCFRLSYEKKKLQLVFSIQYTADISGNPVVVKLSSSLHERFGVGHLSPESPPVTISRVSSVAHTPGTVFASHSNLNRVRPRESVHENPASWEFTDRLNRKSPTLRRHTPTGYSVADKNPVH